MRVRPPPRISISGRPRGPQPRRRGSARTPRRFETVEARRASARLWTAAVLRRFQVDQFRCAHRRDFELGQKRRRAGGRRSDRVANVRWNVRRAGGRRSDRASSPLSVVRAFGAGSAFRVGRDRGTGSPLASRIEPVPLPHVSVFARSYECGQASAVSERAHGRGDIGAPASGTASLLNSHQKPSERRPPARRHF